MRDEHDDGRRPAVKHAASYTAAGRITRAAAAASRRAALLSTRFRRGRSAKSRRTSSRPSMMKRVRRRWAPPRRRRYHASTRRRRRPHAHALERQLMNEGSPPSHLMTSTQTVRVARIMSEGSPAGSSSHHLDALGVNSSTDPVHAVHLLAAARTPGPVAWEAGMRGRGGCGGRCTTLVRRLVYWRRWS